MSSSGTRGDPPVPSAVVILHRDSDDVGDGAPNDGCIFVGPIRLPPARSTLAWLARHGYSVRVEYVPDASAAQAAYPNISLDVGDHVRDEGAAILAADPAILATLPQASSSSPPAPFSVPHGRSPPFDASTPSSVTMAVGGIRGIIFPPENNINLINPPTSPPLPHLWHLLGGRLQLHLYGDLSQPLPLLRTLPRLMMVLLGVLLVVHVG